MKKFSATEKPKQPIVKPRFTALEKELPHENRTTLAAFVLTGLIGYLAYTLCSHIPVMDYTTAIWPVFG